MMKKKHIKINALQKRTLALFQELACHADSSQPGENEGEVKVSYLPQAHGNHVHIGKFVVSRQDSSGFSNEAVWKALERKGLARSNYPVHITLTAAGLSYDTGHGGDFDISDH